MRLVPELPLPAGSFVAGLAPRVALDDATQAALAASAPFDPRAPQACVAYLYGLDLFHAGCAFEAHEVWEPLWLRATDDEARAFLQALIRLAAAAVKLRQGNAVGVRSHVQGAAALLARVETETYGGLAVEALRRFISAVVPDPPRAPQGYAFAGLLPWVLTAAAQPR